MIVLCPDCQAIMLRHENPGRYVCPRANKHFRLKIMRAAEMLKRESEQEDGQ